MNGEVDDLGRRAEVLDHADTDAHGRDGTSFVHTRLVRSDLPAGTVTFLFTDIEGSTRLLKELGADSYAEALGEHRRLLRAVFAAHGGVEVDTQGDAFFVAFPTAPGAVAAAISGQEVLASGPITVRMGLHTGAPMANAEGYVGIDVHRGARVGALAHGGQIIISSTTAALVEDHLQRDLGRHRLKDSRSAPSSFRRCGRREPSISPRPQPRSSAASKSCSRLRRSGSTATHGC